MRPIDQEQCEGRSGSFEGYFDDVEMETQIRKVECVRTRCVRKNKHTSGSQDVQGFANSGHFVPKRHLVDEELEVDRKLQSLRDKFKDAERHGKGSLMQQRRRNRDGGADAGEAAGEVQHRKMYVWKRCKSGKINDFRGD